LRLDIDFSTHGSPTLSCETGTLSDTDGGAMSSGSMTPNASQLEAIGLDPSQAILPGVFVYGGAASFQFVDVLWENNDSDAPAASD
jgi:hypothetical protein